MPFFPNELISRLSGSNVNSRVDELSAEMSNANKQALLDLIDSLSTGQTILGKILSINESKLTIQTDEGVILQAKNDSGGIVEAGESVIFQVHKSLLGQISLRPLYQNTSSEQTAVAALRQAGLPINSRSIEMTSRNMEFGAGIDRQSLIASYKDVSGYPASPVQNIVELQQLGLAVSKENLSLYDAYKNEENLVTDSFASIADNISNELSGLMKDYVATGRQLAVDALNQAELSSTSFTLEELSKMSGNDSLEKLQNGFDSLTWILGDESKPDESENAQIVNEANAKLYSEFFSDKAQSDEMNVQAGQKDFFKNITDTVSLLGKTPIFNFDEKSGEISANPLFDELMNKLGDVVDNKLLREFINEELTKKWTLDKSGISNKGEIKNLFERLYSHTNDILNQFDKMSVNNTELLNSIQNLKSNIDFMNTINQFVPYVQIPFSNDGKPVANELMVYTNKKKTQSSGSDVSAFLHLAMPNLGCTDVYVKLSDGERVSTNFTFENDDVLELVSKNMHFLEKRIKERGYSFNSELKVSKEHDNMMNQIINTCTHKLKNSDTSFDARV